METRHQHTSDWGRVYNPRLFLSSKIPPPIISRASSLIKTSLARSFRSGTTGRVSIVCKGIDKHKTINQTSWVPVVSLVKTQDREEFFSLNWMTNKSNRFKYLSASGKMNLRKNLCLKDMEIKFKIKKSRWKRKKQNK